MTRLLTGTATPVVVGDVECVNCGRTLADAIKLRANGAVRLAPRPDGTLDVEIRGGSRLLCTRCGGRAFIEFDRAV